MVTTVNAIKPFTAPCMESQTNNLSAVN